MLITMGIFFTHPTFTNPRLLFAWATLTLMLLNTAVTVINIPYGALTPEITDDYHEQTSLNGYRFGCAVFGTIIGAAAVQPLTEIFSDLGGIRTGWSLTGFLLGAIIALTTLLTFLGTKEKDHSKEDIPTDGFFSTYRGVFSNRPYVLLLFTYALHMMGITFLQSILAYYCEYILIRPDITPLAMLILLVTAMLFIPVSVLVSKKIGKKKTYQICFLVIASACLVIFFSGSSLGVTAFLCLMVFAGVGVGFSYVPPYAMIPDTIEYDAVHSGKRKEGAYYGLWTFISKLGMALSVMISGFILSWGGYAANAIQGENATIAIRLIIGPIPAVILIAATIVIQFYFLDESAYKKLKNK